MAESKPKSLCEGQLQGHVLPRVPGKHRCHRKERSTLRSLAANLRESTVLLYIQLEGRPREQGETLVKIHVFIYIQYKSFNGLLF